MVFRRLRRRQPAAARPPARPPEPGRHPRQPRRGSRPLASRKLRRASRRTRCWNSSRPSTRGCAHWSTAPSSHGRSSGCRPRVEALANELVDGFPEREAFDLLPAFAAPLPITIIAEMLGVPVEMGPQLLDWSHQMVAMYTHGRTRETEETANRAAREFADFLRGYVAERRKSARRRPAVAADRGARRGPEAHRGRTGVVGDPAAQRRPRGDGPPDRQRGARHPHAGRRPAPLLRLGGSDRRDGGGMPALRRAAASFHALCLRDDGDCAGCQREIGRDDRAAARHGEPRSQGIRRSGRLPPRPHRPEERLLRRRHPFLHRRAAGAAGAAGRVEGAVRAAAGSASGGSARLPRQLAFSRAGKADGHRLTA